MFNVPCSIARYDDSCVDLNVKENSPLIRQPTKCKDKEMAREKFKSLDASIFDGLSIFHLQ